jgi:SAM-dependent methyltransferase
MMLSAGSPTEKTTMKKMYQSHQGLEHGMSDSALKLERLGFPSDLNGKAFLDIGCNEGFFCGKALERGATRVVGIDFEVNALEFAKSRYPGAEYVRSSWKSLPPGPFDVVQWTSAMHYELDPASIFKQIHQRLSLNGLLILECGAFDRSAKELIQVQRHSDTLWYPTIRLLTEDFLRDFSVRCVSECVIAEGDPVPRYVFHCRKRVPSVLLIRDKSETENGVLSDCLISSATKIVRLDTYISRIAGAKHHHNDLQKLIRDQWTRTQSFDAVYAGIDTAGMTEQFARAIAQSVAPTDKLVVIEGAVSDTFSDALSSSLNTTAKVWQIAGS